VETLKSIVWGGESASILTRHGDDVRAWNPDCSWYDYGLFYGLDGCQHPGMDISLPDGTNLYAVGPGTVMCAGTNVGEGYDQGGCAAYEDDYGRAGRVELLLDDGSVAIYGHSSQALKRIGERVATGDLIAKSGYANSAHLHFEYRVPDSRCTLGYAAVDPMPLLKNASLVTEQFASGVTLEVRPEDGLRLREDPGLTAPIITVMQPGEEVSVLRGPTVVDGYLWYFLETRFGRGWSAGEYLSAVNTKPHSNTQPK
jgi:hypothetical protein